MNQMVIRGVNSQTFIAANIKRTEDFYSRILGLPVVKRTVHHHDARLPIVTFGFQSFRGEPQRGETITYIEWNPIFYMMPDGGFVEPDATRDGVANPRVGDPKGRWGAGTNHHLALHVPNRDGLLMWKRRLSDHGVHVTGPYNRHYFHAIYLRDPDGAIIEIATTEPGFGHDEAVLGSGFRPQPKENLIGGRDELQVAAETWPQPLLHVTADFALRGFHHITSISSNAEKTASFFVEKVGLRLIKKTDYLDEKGGTHFYYACDEDLSPGSVLTFFGLPGYKSGRLGTGLSHHFALEVENDAALADEHARFKKVGIGVSTIQDTVYARQFLFRDPDGHICALSTPNRFSIDEDTGCLGQKLCLPEHLEGERREIERHIAYRPAPVPVLP
ncbi:VOC family protein [Rhizobium leguminosarum]|uniref:VOC family protein n=1 Tax=Rhizobium leguminosarum TaxID=384 RepID=UPI0010405C1C|nr:VOC family protein [Rhizobium leguminosarum]MBY5779397.1 glyoxalase [Rhizobium leguminosarum]MBY5827502.1 glyoxalase [Rhizobium leguminosarum]NKM65106.1 glyoxalase [Rhizobium leguminosarum bv. viciae]TBZ47231.1 glyoxalase [Rhizobium leguminosarum bv. viciae]